MTLSAAAAAAEAAVGGMDAAATGKKSLSSNECPEIDSGATIGNILAETGETPRAIPSRKNDLEPGS